MWSYNVTRKSSSIKNVETMPQQMVVGVPKELVSILRDLYTL